MLILPLILVGLALKLLLFPAYHSTDFDVHRNWLAITSSLPLKEWYFENTNQWTLDYPPFFAYFEFILSKLVPASVKRDGCLDIIEKGQYGWPTIVFQRSSVVVSELFFAASLVHMLKCRLALNQNQKNAVFALLWLSPAWIILDHIHFQYNAMMYGLLVFSINFAAENRLLLSAFCFSTLLCFKHIYLYLAPAYFAYLLGAYIIPPVQSGWRRIQWVNGFKLGSVVLAPIILCFLPFYNQMDQVLSRLFPFSRGLTHAYWAPNFWALYSFADRAIAFVRHNAVSSTTRGIVGQVDFSNLPNISPGVTFCLTLFYQVLALIPVIAQPSFDRFLKCMTLCAYASFMFGWHVHEKAVVLMIVPFTFYAFQSRKLMIAYLILIAAGYASLMPLIYTPQECVFKYAYTGLYVFVAMWTLPDIANVKNLHQRFSLERPAFVYTVAFGLVFPILWLFARLVPKYEFLELMLLSVYCALGVTGSWISLCSEYFYSDLFKEKV